MKADTTALALALLLATAGSAAAQATQELPLAGAAYRIADQAYAAYAQGRYAEAEALAREAVRLRPDVERLHDLLRKSEQALAAPTRTAARPRSPGAVPAREMDATALVNRIYRLQVADRLDEAWVLVQEAGRRHPHDAAIEERRRLVGAQLAASALRAAGEDETERLQAARTAIARYAPTDPELRLYLIDQLLAAGQPVDAEAEAVAAANTLNQPALWSLSAVLQQQRGDRAAAIASFRSARAAVAAGAALPDDLALLESDAALAAGDAAQATASLSGLPADHAAANERRQVARLLPGFAILPDLSLPPLDCAIDRYGVTCPLGQPSGPAAALHAAALHALAAQDTSRAATLTAQLQALAEVLPAATPLAAQLADALQQSRAEAAYAALNAGHPGQASAMFRELDAQAVLAPRLLQDAAYAALTAGDRQAANGYFRRAIDAADAGAVTLTPQQRFTLRSAVTDTERNQGFSIASSYRGNSALTMPTASALPGDSLQTGAEAWWRPRALEGDGRYADVYARLLGTHYSEAGAATGSRSVQGAVGLRWKPLRRHNLVIAGEKLVRLGNASLDDWLLRLGYSWSQGMQLRVDADRWWSTQLYTEAGRYLQLGNTYFVSEFQFGRSYRLADTTVLTPHLVAAADYNSGFAVPCSVGVGAGANLRYWFRQDHHAAPRSSLTLSVQYRAHLSGDERAGGFFFRTSLDF